MFAAKRIGADRREGIALRLRTPGGDGPDALTLVDGGRALVGVTDIHDLAIARERGVDVVAVGALVQRPLAALLADRSVRRPRDLAGRTVGVSGLPSDPAFLRAIVEEDGGDYEAIRQVTIGFQAVPALVGRRVDAVPAFWNAEGVALERRGVKLRQFRIEDFGAPVYPEVVFVASRRALERDRAAVAATMRAVAAGVEEVLARPGPAVRDGRCRRDRRPRPGRGAARRRAAALPAGGPPGPPGPRAVGGLRRSHRDRRAPADVDEAFDLTVAGG